MLGGVADRDILSGRWHNEDQPPSLVASEIVSLCQSLESDFGGLHALWSDMLGMYEPRALGSFLSAGARAYLNVERGADVPDVRYPLSRSLVDTVGADIAGRQRPKPIAMTNGADWQTRRKARKLGRFVVGQMALKQGKYLDAWECLTDTFVGACITGINFVYVWGDPEAGRVRMERVPPGEMYWDPEDAGTGEPSNLFRVRWMDEDALLYTYVDQPLAEGDIDEEEAANRRMRIQASPSRDAGSTDHRRLARQVKTYEAWHLPLGDRPGRHSLAVDGALLVDEEWTRDDFPFLVMRWAPEREGFGGIGIVEESRTMADELNNALEFAQKQHILCAGRRIFYHRGSVEEEDLQANNEETLIPVRQGDPFPQETVVAAINPSTLQWAQLIRDLAHEGVGVSQMSAQGRKEPGVESGIAIRNLVDLATKRFSVKAAAYDNSYIRLFQLIVRAVQDLVEQGVSVRSSFPGEEFWDDLEWTDVDLEEDIYTVQIDTVSASADRAAGRIATAQESLQSGLINAEAFSRIVPPGGTLDLENEAGPVTKQQRYLDSLIDRYLDATEDDAEFRFEGPEGFILDVAGAVNQFVGAYFEAKMGRAPEFNLQLLRDYIAELDELVKNAAQAAAQLQAQAAGAPQPGAAPPQQGMAA